MNPCGRIVAFEETWEFLYGNKIPFEHQLNVVLYYMPGVIIAICIGVLVNVILEWIVSKIHLRASKSNYWALIGLGLIIYLVFFTPFCLDVAAKTQWYKIVTPPWIKKPPAPPTRPYRASLPPSDRSSRMPAGVERSSTPCASA